nr:hypothetical protein GCM10025699_41390 [Microbacterium flavescens]
MTAAVTADQTLHGRNKITSKAVRRVVSAVTAEALEVSASDVSVELADRDGALSVVAKTPIRISPWASPPGRRARSSSVSRRPSPPSARVCCS